MNLQANEYRTTAEIDLGQDDFVTVQVVYHVDSFDGDIDDLNVYDEAGADIAHLVNESEWEKCKDAAYADMAGTITEMALIRAEDAAENRKESGSWMTRKVGGGW